MMHRKRATPKRQSETVETGPFDRCNCRFRVVVYDGGSSRGRRTCCLKGMDPSDAGWLCLKKELPIDLDELEDGDALFGKSPFEGPHSEAELEDLFNRLENLE